MSNITDLVLLFWGKGKSRQKESELECLKEAKSAKPVERKRRWWNWEYGELSLDGYGFMNL